MRLTAIMGLAGIMGLAAYIYIYIYIIYIYIYMYRERERERETSKTDTKENFVKHVIVASAGCF